MSLPRKTTRSAGFTLLELMIVVVIIGIISAGIIPSFSSYIRNQNLRQAQEQLKSDMRTIQNKALTGALSDMEVGGISVKYWAIKFVNGTSSYDYYITRNTTCPPGALSGVLQGKGTFNSNLKIYNSATPTCVFFSMLNGDIASTLISGGVGTVSVGYSAAEVKSVLFNSAGLIYSTN